MSQEMTEKQLLMKKSIRRACVRERIVGMMYFCGSAIMTLCSLLPILTGLAFAKNGNLSMLSFWDPIHDVSSLKFSVIALGMNFFTSVLYVFTVGFCIGNLIYSCLQLGKLFIKGRKRIGYNQNAFAMDKLGKAFSRTFLSLMYITYFTHMFMGAKPTALFYAVMVMFLAIHFIGGFVGMGASRFTVRGGLKECPRTKGRVAPMLRNALQFLFIGILMYYMSEANIINNFLWYFDKNVWFQTFGSFKLYFGTIVENCFNPLLQLSICHFMLILVIHATGTTEWQREGANGKGMKNTMVFSALIAVFALAFNGIRLYLNLAHNTSSVSLQMLFVAVVAIALFVIEICMAKLPGDRKVQAAEPVDELVEEEIDEELEGLTRVEVLPVGYTFVQSPAVYEQPDGSHILALPLEEELVEEDDDRVYATPIAKNALLREEYKKAMKERWLARANGDPSEADRKVYKKPDDEDEELELGEAKKVKCPHCGNIVWAKEGAPAYICPECQERFSF